MASPPDPAARRRTAGPAACGGSHGAPRACAPSGACLRSADPCVPGGITAERLTELRRGRLLLPVDDGGPADGPAVVLLHGFPADRRCWDAVRPHLHEAGLRTLAPDQRGYAPSARPPRRSDYRLEHLVGDVLALLDAAGLDRAHVVGHDWGGGVAWSVAAHRPDRVASLTAVSTPHPRALLAAMLRSDQALRSAYMALVQLPRLPELLLARRLPELLRRSGLPEETARRYAGRTAEPGALTAALNWYRALPLSPLLAGPVDVPTTYVWGRGDPALGPWAAARTARYVRGPYEFVPLDAGHWLPETRAAEVAAAVVARVAA